MFLKNIINLFFTEKCFLCGNPILSLEFNYICESEIKNIIPIKVVNKKKCKKCLSIIYDNSEFCSNCKNMNFLFIKNNSIFYYKDEAIRELVHRFKFENNKRAGDDLAKLLKPHLLELINNLSYDLITVVPLSLDSLKKRGFNQVEYILNKCNIRYEKLLFRKKHIKRQSELNAIERMTYIKDQFGILEDKINLIKNKKIIIVDDIFTTGATSNELTKLFLNNKASSVEIITFFRD